LASFQKFNQFVADLANKVHNLGSDTLKIALFTSTTAPTVADATYDDTTNHTLNSSGAAEVAAGNGYTQGGVAVGTVTSTQTSGTYKLVPSAAGNCTWTASGTGFSARYAVLYNESAGSAGARPVIGWWDYGSNLPINSGVTFTVDLDTTNGILQLA